MATLVVVIEVGRWCGIACWVRLQTLKRNGDISELNVFAHNALSLSLFLSSNTTQNRTDYTHHNANDLGMFDSNSRLDSATLGDERIGERSEVRGGSWRSRLGGKD